MESILSSLYGEKSGQAAYHELQRLLSMYREKLALTQKNELDEHDAMLITYADQVRQADEKPLDTLVQFCSRYLAEAISSIHILPFFPYSSDDGFSVIDYKQVNADFGDWAAVEHLGKSFRLMFDAVINHSSIQHTWFRSFLQNDEKYRHYYIEVAESTDLSQVVRPRALPLLTKFQTAAGAKSVWTTFSADQVDLNYACPELLLDIIDIMLDYVSKGAEFIRLDAIAYLWKEIGTPCIHLPQTHAVIQLLRRIFDDVAPYVKLITETNVPHQENISYFGDGQNEAQLVYNFSLPPLTLHAISTGSSQVISNWAEQLRLPSNRVTFFNFLASHDGIGLNPARGIIPENEIHELALRAENHRGFVSYKTNSDGSKSPYEININYFDALTHPDSPEPLTKQADRFMCSQAIMLALRGLPGIYFHSLVGSRGWPEGVDRTGHNRTINRQKLQRTRLEKEIKDNGSLRNLVFYRYLALLKARSSAAAFNPYGQQKVMDFGDRVFALRRISPDGKQHVLCLQNISDSTLDIKMPAGSSLLNRNQVYLNRESKSLSPYQVEWVQLER